MKIGYARISTVEQNLDLQMDELKRVGCEMYFTDKTSGTKETRPGLDKMIAQLRPGDTVVVWKLDRLGRSLSHLISLITEFEKIGVEFRSIQEGIDTSTHMGRLVFHLFGAIAQFERGLIQERTLAGLSAARARGRMGGRPKGLSKSAQMKAAAAKTLYEKGFTIADICKQLDTSPPTLYRYLRAMGVVIGK